MLKKIPIQWRLTVLSVLLLCLCCVGLTVILNFSALHMANTIEAIQVTPAQNTQSDNAPQLSTPSIEFAPTFPEESSQAAKNHFTRQSALYMALVVLLGGGLTYYISGKALKPLQELSGEMQRRTVENLSEHLPVPQSRDEIANLTQSFNQMSEKLEEAFAAQKRFSQSAAHELRTPLTVLKAKVDVFKKKETHTGAEYDALLFSITAYTDRLSDLVKDLLSLSNMDALDCTETIALVSLLYEVCEELSVLAKSNGVTVTVSGKEASVKGNRSLLHRTFYNLLENAIKYNQKGGAVRIDVAIAEGRSLITLSDTGIGISQEEQQHIFEPFYRVDKSRSRQMGGAGLGLSTVKAIVEKHNGTIEVRENPDGGTILAVVL